MTAPSGHSGLTCAGAKLIGANLNGRFEGVDFAGADLTNAIFGPRDPREEVLITPMMSLADANFKGAILIGADLSRDTLENANFADADLAHANLRGARLGGANFGNANLAGADLTGAETQGAYLKAARGIKAAIGVAATP
jgi:uncharacterized protein YjbI with pentapeptide repeats